MKLTREKQNISNNNSRCGNIVGPGDDLDIFVKAGACGITLVITDAGADCVKLNNWG